MLPNLFEDLTNQPERIIIPVRNIFFRKGYRWFTDDKPFNVKLWAVRSKLQRPNKFCDWFFLTYKDNDGNYHLKKEIGTTLPGVYYLQNYSNPKGLAALVPGQYIAAFKKYKYNRLAQNATLKVTRDNNKDNKLDFINVQDAPPNCRIDFHSAKSTLYPDKVQLQNVGRFSEACQVLANWATLESWIKIIHYSMKLFNSNTISYTLLEEEDFH